MACAKAAHMPKKAGSPHGRDPAGFRWMYPDFLIPFPSFSFWAPLSFCPTGNKEGNRQIPLTNR